MSDAAFWGFALVLNNVVWALAFWCYVHFNDKRYRARLLQESTFAQEESAACTTAPMREFYAGKAAGLRRANALLLMCAIGVIIGHHN